MKNAGICDRSDGNNSIETEMSSLRQHGCGAVQQGRQGKIHLHRRGKNKRPGGSCAAFKTFSVDNIQRPSFNCGHHHCNHGTAGRNIRPNGFQRAIYFGAVADNAAVRGACRYRMYSCMVHHNGHLLSHSVFPQGKMGNVICLLSLWGKFSGQLASQDVK